MKLIGCTDGKTYASMCNICSHKPEGNNCNHADTIKLYDGEDTGGFKLIGCHDSKEFFMCSMCMCTPDGISCKGIQESKVYSLIK